jgi:fatty acyl-ACP thioesterase B
MVVRRPEVIEIDSWVAQAGKNGMRRDWVMRSFHTGEVLARATSTWCMMHATTRRLSKIPDDVRSEIQPSFVNHLSAYHQHECAAPRISKLGDVSAEHHRSQLTSTLADLDMNQHVNNLKYINWVLEVCPISTSSETTSVYIYHVQ